MKELKYVPIYKGEYNVIPQVDDIEDIEDSDEPDIIIEYSSWMEWLSIMICCGYLLLSVVR